MPQKLAEIFSFSEMSPWDKFKGKSESFHILTQDSREQLFKTALRVGFWTNFAKYFLRTSTASLENISYTNNISIESSDFLF